MDLDHHDLAKLAREMAMGIRDPEDVLARNNVSAKEFAKIEQLDVYKQCYEAFLIDWNKPKTTAERLRQQSLVFMELILPDVAGRMQNLKEPLAAVVDAGKLLARVGGLDSNERPASVGAADKFVITINLGAGQVETYEKQIEQGPKDVEVKTIADT